MSDARARAERLVVEALARTIEGAPRVLLAGVTRDDGAAELCALLRAAMPTHLVRDLSHTHAPSALPVIIEGPALGEGAGFAALDDAFLKTLSGLVLVVRAEHSPRPALAQIVAWASARRLHLFGVVWNETTIAKRPWRKHLVARLMTRQLPAVT